MQKLFKYFALFFTLTLLVGCANPDVSVQPNTGGSLDGGEGGDSESPPIRDLVDTIASQPQFQYFSDALEFTQLEGLLRDMSRAYTVTVPTDAAFNSLGEDRRAFLLSRPAAMRNLLLRHISPIVASSAELEANGAFMLDGSSRLFPPSQIGVRDLEATNGNVHGINTVFDAPSIDPSGATIIEALSADGRFSGLVAALSLTSLADTLDVPGQSLTFFAPTNSAFVQLGVPRVRALYDDTARLERLLSYHLINTGALDMADFGDAGGVSRQTAAGVSVLLANISGSLLVNNIRILPAAIPTSNGVIYVIETVLPEP